MTRVKICGVTNHADLRAVADAGADAVGVISEVPVDSPREVDPATAADLTARAPPFLTTVLVTMPETPAEAVDLVRTVAPDVLQVHGEFGPEELGFVRAETETKVVPVVDYADADRARELDEAADAVVVDSTDDEGAGGTGETGDWAATADLVRDLVSPVVLAGGLTPENVADAISAVEPFAVDVASGVERTGGAKDHTAVARFVRNAGRSLGEAEEVYG
ncbi:phosphoribosylanthranilate isomerase [Candidatus Halobonum tyrrellensis]|uniref:N-(5'-phosphoribosyl)anthranilate isomerase n=1 Tax=Candidatus Halobonum tyrrellensis G22 TaxID=1324957 RepID=V4HDV8_9EURY|nr:phosphoribosylanthranilate isomerase [Candidatus Halobonum tyrrellensis]ESP88253.1 phosphoribosylanthranilate isomerase [Candidatus Halobonum tyrrellensis G22]